MGTKTETPGRVTELPRPSRWGPGYSPKELLEQALDKLERIDDIVIMARYAKTSDVEDGYSVVSSTMPVHELLGFIELGKMMLVSTRCAGVDDDPEAG